MMRVLDIALKDMLRSIRSASFLAFGFFVPLLVSGIFYFAFGGMASGDGGSDLPVIQVQVTNLDGPDSQYEGLSVGQMLVDVLRAKDLAKVMQVTAAADPTSARAAVDRQDASVAIIIPAGFTNAALAAQGQATIELYQDPTLVLGPAIVESIIRQMVDGFSGTKIASDIAARQLAAHGVTVDAAMQQGIQIQYREWATALGQSQQEGTSVLLETRSPASAETEATEAGTDVISMIMSGMMVFYVFFTGAASAQSLLQEEEAGTLARLFTTPTPQSAILGGRLLATLVTLVVQVAVLLVLSALVFRINWGRPLPLVLVTLGMVVLSAAFGLFVTSLLKNSRQGGVVYGGVLTVAGMVGMIGIFTVNVPNASTGPFETISLLVPHGWAVRGYSLLLEGGGASDVLPTFVAMLILSLAFFLVGLMRFRKRFS
jgi:ABC-2 type transport system permease protein